MRDGEKIIRAMGVAMHAVRARVVLALRLWTAVPDGRRLEEDGTCRTRRVLDRVLRGRRCLRLAAALACVGLARRCEREALRACWGERGGENEVGTERHR